MSTGMTSSAVSSPAGIDWWPFSTRYTSGAVVLKPSFQPGNGNFTELSTTAGRTIVATTSWSARMTCSPRLLVYVYVLVQPQCSARSMPSSVSRWAIHSLRSRATASLRSFSSSASRRCSSSEAAAFSRNSEMWARSLD